MQPQISLGNLGILGLASVEQHSFFVGIPGLLTIVVSFILFVVVVTVHWRHFYMQCNIACVGLLVHGATVHGGCSAQTIQG